MSQLPPNIAELTGPLFLGHILNWALLGVLGVQIYIYYLAFPKDKPSTKLLVGAIAVIEVLQSVLSIRDGFRNFGTNWGDLPDLNVIGWLWFSAPILDVIISSIVQFFYAWRIWILSKQLYIPIVVVLISVAQLVAGSWTGIHAAQLGVFSEIQNHVFKTTSIWLGGTALCDVIIASSMIYYLSKSRTGFRATNILISKILRITVETGLFCAAFAILDLVLFLVFRDNNYHLAPSIALSKLYSNSLLALFNARIRIVGGRGASACVTEVSSLGTDGIAFASALSKDHETAITMSVVATSNNTEVMELNEPIDKFSTKDRPSYFQF